MLFLFIFNATLFTQKGSHYYKDKQRSVGMVEAHDHHLHEEKKLREMFKAHDADGVDCSVGMNLEKLFVRWVLGFLLSELLVHLPMQMLIAMDL